MQVLKWIYKKNTPNLNTWIIAKTNRSPETLLKFNYSIKSGNQVFPQIKLGRQMHSHNHSKCSKTMEILSKKKIVEISNTVLNC